MKSSLNIEMLSTGDEVLYGQITDTNATWLSDYLFAQGYVITSRYTQGDNLQQLIATLQQRSQVNDILIVNGGLGPTSDDLTAQAAAQANHESLVLFPQWVEKMQQYFAQRGKPMPSSNMKQAMLPSSATIIDNPVGTACGFHMIINNCQIYFTPGVPSEFKQMVSQQIIADLQSKFPILDKPCCYRLTTMGRTESDLADEIESTLTVPDDITIGYRSAMPFIELKLTAKQSQQPAMDKLWYELNALVKDNLIYVGTIGLAPLVSQLLREHHQPIIIIEQQTAGLIAYPLYNNQAPIICSQVLGIDQDIGQIVNQLKSTYPQAVILALHDYDIASGRFKLQLLTANHKYYYQLKYNGRRYHLATEQTILVAVAHDILRRHLLRLPLIGQYTWLQTEQIDSVG